MLSASLEKGDIVCLFGNLGSGKTVLAKGIAEGLGVKRDKVISPTFIILREHHKGRIPFYHFDFYRLQSPGDILALGYDEYFYGGGVTVIEWADRLKWLLPKELLKIELTPLGASGRLIKLSASGKRYERLIKHLKTKS